MGTATTNSEGIYTLPNVAPDTWEIDFVDHSHRYAGAIQPGVETGKGVTTAPTQKLQLGASFVGKILTSTKKPIKGAQLQPFCASDGKKSGMLPVNGYGPDTRSFFTSRTGAFSITGEEAGLCTFLISLPHSGEWYIRKQTFEASNTFSISAGKTTNVGSVALLPASIVKTTFKALGHHKLAVAFHVAAAPKVTGQVTIDCVNDNLSSEENKTMNLKSGNASTTLTGLPKGIYTCSSSYTGSATVANYNAEYTKIGVK